MSTFAVVVLVLILVVAVIGGAFLALRTIRDPGDSVLTRLGRVVGLTEPDPVAEAPPAPSPPTHDDGAAS